jgi:hypothetical protein
MFWVFKLSFVVDILAFLTWPLFGLFFKKFGDNTINNWHQGKEKAHCVKTASAQCYKTFYNSSLQMFVVSSSACPRW